MRIDPGILALASISFAGSAIAQQPWTVERVLALETVSEPLLGDDFVVFSRAVPRPLGDGAGPARIHVGVFDGLDAALAGSVEPRMLVAGSDSASGVAVRPGTRAVTLVEAIDGVRQLHSVSIDGGERTRIAETVSIGSYRWRPDGKAFAFTSTDELPPARKAAHDAGIRPVVVDEDWRPRSLWIWEDSAGARKLTEGTSVFAFEWSPDGTRLACACAPRNLVDDSYMFKRLQIVDVATGVRRRLVDNPGKLGDFAWSADGAHVAYVSAADPNDPHAGMLYSVDVESGEVRALTRGLLGMVHSVEPMDDGFLLLESVGVRTRMRHVDVEGLDRWIFDPKSARIAIDGVAVGSHLAFTASSHRHPSELFLMPRGQKEYRRLTDTNAMVRDAPFGEQSVVRFRARDRLPIEGVLIEPIGYEKGTRYPLVIVVHGGPEAHNQDGWLTSYSRWGQLLAARGYFVWFPNYRASTGYGVEFCKQDHGDPMGKEFEDHLDAIDHFTARGLVDPDRVGIGGGSYGGYTAAWAATKHSERFAAAVSFVPFVHIPTKWMTSDIPWEFYYVHYQEKWPWQQPGLLEDRSPLRWAHECDTPLLLAGGLEDPRVHPSQPLMLFRAVKLGTDTPTRLVQYPGEGHGNRTNVYRYDYALRTLRWFDHYLGAADRRGAPLPPLDLPYALPE